MSWPHCSIWIGPYQRLKSSLRVRGWRLSAQFMSRHCSARRSGRPKSIVCCTGFLLAALLFCSVSRGSVAAPLAPNSLNLQEARVSVAYRHVLDGALARLKTWCAVQGEEQPETFCNDAFSDGRLVGPPCAVPLRKPVWGFRSTPVHSGSANKISSP